MAIGIMEVLLERALVSRNDLARAEQLCALVGARLPATLTRLGLVSETELVEALAEATGCGMADLGTAASAAAILEDINPAFLRRHSVLPLTLEDGRLTLAMADPLDEPATRAIAFAAGTEVRPLLASFGDIEAALAAAYPPQHLDEDASPLSAGNSEDLERLVEGDSAAPVIRLVHRILAAAIDRHASDVHIEPMARHLAVRYRVDGRLIEIERHPETMATSIASRIKVMAGLDIAESRLPQDGRLRLTVRGRDVDVRVSTSPIAHGESIVLRLLSGSNVPLDLQRLGLPAGALDKLHRALARPHGVILVTGPTGSGKTTTLYAALNHLRRPEVKILTVEDPVEVLLEGVNQVQVRPEIDLSYATALRAFLRQDPDILMIGEIRDGETADIAVRAALTGHLVLSTLHTNSAAGAFTRLADIGVEPFLTASTVIASVAQRLIRALCGDCKSSTSPSAEELILFEQAGLGSPSDLPRAVGCRKCGGTGYSGRIPLMEILEVDELGREQIRGDRIAELEARVPLGDSLLGHGLALAAAGRTTLEEVQRAVHLG